MTPLGLQEWIVMKMKTPMKSMIQTQMMILMKQHLQALQAQAQIAQTAQVTAPVPSQASPLMILKKPGTYYIKLDPMKQVAQSKRSNNQELKHKRNSNQCTQEKLQEDLQEFQGLQLIWNPR